MLLRLAYLTVTTVFAVLRLLPESDRDKDTEILVLRDQIAVLERQLGERKVRFTPPDRALLAALLHRFRPQALRRMRLLVRPDTVLRWHRDLIKRRHAARSKPKGPGRPPTVRSIRTLVLRLVRENPAWGYRRVHGELLVLGVKVAPSTVWEILKDAAIDPAPERSATTWADFLRSQAEAQLACDFLETVSLSGTRMFVLAVIARASRRVIVSLDLDSTVPPFEQIRSQIAMMAASGVLPPGARLPPIRQLAADLGLAAGTVSRAYRELEAAGVLVASGRHGSHIAQPPVISQDERDDRLRRAAAGYAQLAAQLGAGKTDALEMAREAIESLT